MVMGRNLVVMFWQLLHGRNDARLFIYVEAFRGK
jgi:hypothetical protein